MTTKPLKQKKCKQCKKSFHPVKPLQHVCGFDCAVDYALALKIKKEAFQRKIVRKEIRDAKVKLKTRSDWMREAQIAFNAYIRARDYGLPCISCQKPMNKKINAGHFRSVGSSPHLRFDENNCHAQCEHCNTYLSGNIGNYRINLVKKIGLHEVECIECDNLVKNYTIDKIKEIKELYKNKAKELNRD